MMIVAGVHLDHAWTGLGASYGSALRVWSLHVLAVVVEEANHRNVGTLLIVGGLFNRSYALPKTIDYASQLFGTFGGKVIIVPGKSDWIDSASLYSTHKWPQNTFVCSASDFQSAESAASVWASAWTSPGGSAPRIQDAPGPRVLVRAGMTETDLSRLGIGPNDLAVTTGAATSNGTLNIPDLVHDPRKAGGFAVLVDSADPAKPAQRVDLPEQPGTVLDIDVTGRTSTDALAEAIEGALAPEGLMLLRLLGTLAPGVLLPGFGGTELPPEVVLDLDSLSFATPPIDDHDRSARAEFLRAMANSNSPDPHRHQTTALGLAALDANVQGA